MIARETAARVWLAPRSRFVVSIALRLVATVCLLVAASCADALAPADVRLSLRNVSSDSIAFVAYDRESTALVDPYFGPIPLSSFGSSVVAPGATVTIAGTDIHSYRVGADVRLFLYSVRGGAATFAQTFDIAGAQLVLLTHRIDLPVLQ